MSTHINGHHHMICKLYHHGLLWLSRSSLGFVWITRIYWEISSSSEHAKIQFSVARLLWCSCTFKGRRHFSYCIRTSEQREWSNRYGLSFYFYLLSSNICCDVFSNNILSSIVTTTITIIIQWLEANDIADSIPLHTIVFVIQLPQLIHQVIYRFWLNEIRTNQKKAKSDNFLPFLFISSVEVFPFILL